MKNRGFYLPILAMVLMFTSFPFLVAAENERAFTATEMRCYSCVCPTCDPGSAAVSANGNLQIRNMESVYFYTASDHRAAGYFRVSINSDTSTTFSGTMWGTFYSCDSSGNRVADGWEGTWSGTMFSAFPSNWINKAIAYGVGANSGFKLEFTTGYGDSLVGTIVGTIQDVRK